MFKEIDKIREIHTYQLHDDWFLEVRREAETDANGKEFQMWIGDIYRRQHGLKMFVCGIGREFDNLKTGEHEITPLWEFLDIMHSELYHNENINFFEDYEMQEDAIQDAYDELFDMMDEQ